MCSSRDAQRNAIDNLRSAISDIDLAFAEAMDYRGNYRNNGWTTPPQVCGSEIRKPFVELVNLVSAWCDAQTHIDPTPLHRFAALLQEAYDFVWESPGAFPAAIRECQYVIQRSKSHVYLAEHVVKELEYQATQVQNRPLRADRPLPALLCRSRTGSRNVTRNGAPSCG